MYQSFTEVSANQHVAFANASDITADIRLVGLRRIAEPFLQSTFRCMGGSALEGHRTRLDAR